VPGFGPLPPPVPVIGGIIGGGIALAPVDAGPAAGVAVGRTGDCGTDGNGRLFMFRAAWAGGWFVSARPIESTPKSCFPSPRLPSFPPPPTPPPPMTDFPSPAPGFGPFAPATGVSGVSVVGG
jgi:hypothetical protein